MPGTRSARCSPACRRSWSTSRGSIRSAPSRSRWRRRRCCSPARCRSTCASRRASRRRHSRARRATVAREPRACCGASAALFALDSVGGGFLTTALLAYFFFERFAVGAGAHRRAVLRRARRQCRSPTSPRPGSPARSGSQHHRADPHAVQPAADDRRPGAELHRSRRCCSCCAKDWSRWTCRPGSPT